ncbi:MAG TPA: glycosyltransferase family 2 protein [Gemmatimonadaceae bacterium]|nr:glycosyltransferase family 2 protein [Gemmatimonadaceae bacterium]
MADSLTTSPPQVPVAAGPDAATAVRWAGKLTVLIPAHNEEAGIARTIHAIYGTLRGESVPHEILVVLDHCTDNTAAVLNAMRSDVPVLRTVVNRGAGGFGLAVRRGLDSMQGDAVAIVMADASDDPRDIVQYYRKLEEGYDCVFGSRFAAGASVRNYPPLKLWLNRMGNQAIRLLFRTGYNDTTNAFKCYRREVVEGLRPFLSNHFNLTVELPLKAMVRGYTWTVVPTNWLGRATGESKFVIKEMGSRYLFIILYCLIEKYFSRGDYVRPSSSPEPVVNSKAERA